MQGLFHHQDRGERRGGVTVTNKINKIPPLSGTPDAKAEQLRIHVNRIIDEVQLLLGERDREILRLRKEIEKYGTKD